jgi:hypothetical protein
MARTPFIRKNPTRCCAGWIPEELCGFAAGDDDSGLPTTMSLVRP